MLLLQLLLVVGLLVSLSLNISVAAAATVTGTAVSTKWKRSFFMLWVCVVLSMLNPQTEWHGLNKLWLPLALCRMPVEYMHSSNERYDCHEQVVTMNACSPNVTRFFPDVPSLRFAFLKVDEVARKHFPGVHSALERPLLYSSWLSKVH